MLIKQTRIRSIQRHFGFVGEGTEIIIGLRNLDQFEETLTKIGFEGDISPGDTLLPPSTFGPVSEYNAEGKNIIHRDQPKETYYQLREWTWEEWRGPYDTEEMSKIVEIPGERYPRTFVKPPSIEFGIGSSPDGELILMAEIITFEPENHEKIIHVVNLFLEIFGECEIFTEDLEELTKPEVKRLNWEILPPGKYPWERLKEHTDKIVKKLPEGKKPVVTYRFKTINEFEPSFHAVGKAGFRGYIVFGFPEKGLYVFESSFYGNATYVFGEDWEELSKMSKAEILDDDLQKERIIHRDSWDSHVKELLFDSTEH